MVQFNGKSKRSCRVYFMTGLCYPMTERRFLMTGMLSRHLMIGDVMIGRIWLQHCREEYIYFLVLIPFVQNKSLCTNYFESTGRKYPTAVA